MGYNEEKLRGFQARRPPNCLSGGFGKQRVVCSELQTSPGADHSYFPIAETKPFPKQKPRETVWRFDCFGGVDRGGSE